MSGKPKKRLPDRIQEGAKPRQQRTVPKEAVEAAINKCQNLLADVQKSKSRPKVTEALASLETAVLDALKTVNKEFQRELVPVIGKLLLAHATELLRIDEQLGSGDRNPARTRLLTLATNLKGQLTKPPVYHFDPLDDENLSNTIAHAFNDQPVKKLSELESFGGSGVYAIYYNGSFELYGQIADDNRKLPGSKAIYVGEAGRDKRKGVQSGEAEKTIYARLADHKASIQFAKNIELDDFSFRYLPIRDLFIPLCESILIETHRPLWNMKLDGFGNKHVGESRKETQQITKWDLLHQGRPNRATVGRKGKYKTYDDVVGLVTEFFKSEQVRQAKIAAGEPVEPLRVEELAEAPESIEQSATESAGAAS